MRRLRTLPWLVPAQAGSLPDPSVQEAPLVLRFALPPFLPSGHPSQSATLASVSAPGWHTCSRGGPTHFCAAQGMSSWLLPCHHQGCHQLPQPCSARSLLGPPGRTGDPSPNPTPTSLLAAPGKPIPTPMLSSHLGARQSLSTLPSPLALLGVQSLLGCLPPLWVLGQEGKSVSIRKRKCVCLGTRG